MDRIARLETFSNEFVCFVRLTTEAWHVGWFAIVGVEIDPDWLAAAKHRVSER
jgi:hypothetical protein